MGALLADVGRVGPYFAVATGPAPGGGGWVPVAALAGPVTHIPGLFYLIALNVIAAHQPSIPDGLVEVLIYNVVWFALPIGALAICVIDPPAARRVVDGLRLWTLSHAHALLLTVSFVAGAGLVIRGVLTV